MINVNIMCSPCLSLVTDFRGHCSGDAWEAATHWLVVPLEAGDERSVGQDVAQELREGHRQGLLNKHHVVLSHGHAVHVGGRHLPACRDGGHHLALLQVTCGCQGDGSVGR